MRYQSFALDVCFVDLYSPYREQGIDELGFEWLGGGTQYIRVSKSSYVTK